MVIAPAATGERHLAVRAASVDDVARPANAARRGPHRNPPRDFARVHRGSRSAPPVDHPGFHEFVRAGFDGGGRHLKVMVFQGNSQMFHEDKRKDSYEFRG